MRIRKFKNGVNNGWSVRIGAFHLRHFSESTDIRFRFTINFSDWKWIKLFGFNQRTYSF